MFKLLKVVLFLCVVLALAEAQLTFTPGWGKRGLAAQSGFMNFGQPDGKCGVSLAGLITKLIQAEVERIIECQKR